MLKLCSEYGAVRRAAHFLPFPLSSSFSSQAAEPPAGALCVAIRGPAAESARPPHASADGSDPAAAGCRYRCTHGVEAHALALHLPAAGLCKAGEVLRGLHDGCNDAHCNDVLQSDDVQ